MEQIFVIGAGTMGLDIAQTFAQAGYKAVVRDVMALDLFRRRDQLVIEFKGTQDMVSAARNRWPYAKSPPQTATKHPRSHR